MYFHPLNFIRFALALGVILFHYGVNYFPFNSGPLNTLIVNSSFRVSFFFFISGFVMCMVYAKQAGNLTAAYFYKRRFARIFPLYWLAFVLTVIVVVFVNKAAPRGLNIILHGIGLQSLNPGHVLDLNYPTWSISVELIFYLIFPFLLKWLVKFGPAKLLAVAFGIWALQSVQHIFFVECVYNGTKVSEEFISAFPLWHFSTFFAGMAAARLIALNAVPGLITKNSVLFMVLPLLAIIYIIYIPNPVLKYVHNGLLVPVFALFIVALYYDGSVIGLSLSHRRIVNLGDFSYGLFIFQYPVWVICCRIADSGFIKSGWFFMIYLGCLFGATWFINRYFEKPLMKKIRRE
ncbi:MAG: acyltransferase [Bacteroidota bacterium]